MNKDPAFLFYSSDFLTGTMFMDDEQVGKYIRLLCSQHQHGHIAEKDMMKICKTYDEDIFEKFVKDEDGKYYQHRLEDEIEKRLKYTNSRRLNGIRGGRPLKPYENHMVTMCEPYENHSENENDNNKIDREYEGKTEDSACSFAVFYKKYPRHIARQDAEKAYSKIKMTAALFVTIMTKLDCWIKSEEWTREKGRFIPYPATWINGKRWEDELQIPLIPIVKNEQTKKPFTYESRL